MSFQNDRSQIMETVSFVLSGFKNPLRSQLRNKATAMGAIFNDDWNEDCTHLMYVADNSAVPHIPHFGDVDGSAGDARL